MTSDPLVFPHSFPHTFHLWGVWGEGIYIYTFPTASPRRHFLDRCWGLFFYGDFMKWIFTEWGFYEAGYFLFSGIDYFFSFAILDSAR